MVRLTDIASEPRKPSGLRLPIQTRNRLIRLEKKNVVLRVFSHRKPLTYTEGWDRAKKDIAKSIYTKHLKSCVQEGLISKKDREYLITPDGSNMVQTLRKEIDAIIKTWNQFEPSSSPYDPIFWYSKGADQKEDLVEMGNIGVRNTNPAEVQNYSEEAHKILRQLGEMLRESQKKFGGATLDVSFKIGPTSSKDKKWKYTY